MLNKFCMMLLCCTLVFSIATELRLLGAIGVAEILALFYIFLRMIFISRNGFRTNKYFSMFFCVFFFAIFLGALTSIFNVRDVYIRDIFAYMYCFLITTLMFQHVAFDKVSSILFLKYFLTVSLLYLFLVDIVAYFYSGFMYEGFRLAGFSSNPNQLALLVLVTFNISFVFCKKMMIPRLWRVAIYVFLLYVSLRTVSEALLVAIFLGFVSYFSIRFSIYSFKRTDRLYVLISVMLMINLALSYFASFVSYSAGDLYGVININNQGDDRFTLWFNGLSSLSDSLVFGNGPGAHSGFGGPFEGVEAHNTFIDMLTQVGLIGFLSFVFLSIYIFLKGGRRDIAYSTFVLVSIFSFAQFHFILRQPLFWFGLVLPILLYYVQKISDNLE